MYLTRDQCNAAEVKASTTPKSFCSHYTLHYHRPTAIKMYGYKVFWPAVNPASGMLSFTPAQWARVCAVRLAPGKCLQFDAMMFVGMD